MRDIEILLDDRPGALATLREALGCAGVSVEGGGVFTYHQTQGWVIGPDEDDRDHGWLPVSSLLL
jgi:hypothetical protein